MNLIERRPELLLVAVTFLWGSTFIVTKGLLRAAPPLLYLLVRFGLAAVVLLALFPRARRARGRILVSGVLLGALQTGGIAVQVFGQVYTTASKSAFVTALSTALTPVLGLLLYGERPRAQQLVGVVLATSGLLALTWPGGDAGWNRGDLLSLACAFIYASVIVETARRSRGEDIAVLATVQTAACALMLLALRLSAQLVLASLPPASVPELLRIEAQPLHASLWLALQLVYMAVMCTVVTFVGQTWAMSRMSATQAAVVFALEPLFATALAIAVDGEAEWPGARGAVGAALILAGVVFAELRSRSPQEPLSDPPSG